MYLGFFGPVFSGLSKGPVIWWSIVEDMKSL